MQVFIRSFEQEGNLLFLQNLRKCRGKNNDRPPFLNRLSVRSSFMRRLFVRFSVVFLSFDTLFKGSWIPIYRFAIKEALEFGTAREGTCRKARRRNSTKHNSREGYKRRVESSWSEQSSSASRTRRSCGKPNSRTYVPIVETRASCIFSVFVVRAGW